MLSTLYSGLGVGFVSSETVNVNVDKPPLLKTLPEYVLIVKDDDGNENLTQNT